jgi:hypothetical protein
MEQLYLFTAVDDKTGNERTTAQEIGCVYPRCGKVRAPNSAYCLHHIDVVAWEGGERERKRQRAAQLKERRRLQEELLAASPLRVTSPQSIEPRQQKRRGKPSSVHGRPGTPNTRGNPAPEEKGEKRILRATVASGGTTITR